jgi:hypothetical protein
MATSSRDALLPRPAYRLAWERLLAAGDPKVACRTMVALLALAHERGCEAELATALTDQVQGTEVAGAIDLAALQARFAPARVAMPEIVVNLPPVSSYDALLASRGEAA